MVRMVLALLLANAAVSLALQPSWSAIEPNASLPLGGLPLLPSARDSVIWRSHPSMGTYNHQPMIQFLHGAMHVCWKNSPFNEDQDGQRVLCSISHDGSRWEDPYIAFPNMSYVHGVKNAATASPFVLRDGERLYAAATMHGAGGSFNIYPAEDPNLIMLRRVLPSSSGKPSLGHIFWAAGAIPPGMEAASKAIPIVLPSDIDSTTVEDAKMVANGVNVSSWTDQGCDDGCQKWATARNGTEVDGERTHYKPLTHASDVILYRSTFPLQKLWTSVRMEEKGEWSPAVLTDIPDLTTNINTGPLPDGSGVFLVSNCVPRPMVRDKKCNRTTQLRQPLCVSVSAEGWDFSKAWALVNTTEPKRYCGSAKSFGPSYPQARAITEPAHLEGFWAVYSINKEDIGITRASLRELNPHG